jgi:hypothetical protein
MTQRINAEGLKQWIFRKRRLRQAYRDCFCGRDGKAHAAGQIALAHMRRFARSNESGLVRDQQGRADPVAMAYAQGLRDFCAMIVLHLNIEDSDLYNYERQEREAKAPHE